MPVGRAETSISKPSVVPARTRPVGRAEVTDG